MTHKYIISGQPVVYNAANKVGSTTIEEPFLKAGKIFGFHGVGVGLNKDIIEFIIKRRAVLILYVASFNHNYWIRWDRLKQNFEKGFRYMAGGRKEVYIIPLEEFHDKMEAVPV